MAVICMTHNLSAHIIEQLNTVCGEAFLSQDKMVRQRSKTLLIILNSYFLNQNCT